MSADEGVLAGLIPRHEDAPREELVIGGEARLAARRRRSRDGRWHPLLWFVRAAWVHRRAAGIAAPIVVRCESAAAGEEVLVVELGEERIEGLGATRSFLGAALRADRASTATAAALAVEARLAAGVNELLGRPLQHVELRTPRGGLRVFPPQPHASARVQVSDACAAGRIELRVHARPAAGLGRWWGDGPLSSAVDASLAARVPWAERGPEGVWRIPNAPAGVAVTARGECWVRPPGRGVWLLRDGVYVAPLEGWLAHKGLHDVEFLQCVRWDDVELDDRGELRESPAAEALAIYLREVLAHTFPGPGGAPQVVLARTLETRRAVPPPPEATRRNLPARPGDATVRLRYDVDATGRPWLAWDPSPQLALVVARRDDGQELTLAGALERVRDGGGLSLREPGRRWVTLESEDPALWCWEVVPARRRLLEQVIGARALWWMPAVAEAHLRPGLPAAQPAARLDSANLADALARCAGDGGARDRVLDHLLARDALETAEPDALAARVVLVRGSAAADATRLVAVTELPEGPLVIAPPGESARDLLEVCIEATPGQAVAWSRLRGVRPARRGPVARGASFRAELVAHAIARPHFAGRLTIQERAAEARVELWARGERVGEVDAGVAGVGGRLWLTDAGIRAGLDVLRRGVNAEAVELRDGVARWVELIPPTSSRATALRAWLAATQPEGPPPAGRGPTAPAKPTARRVSWSGRPGVAGLQDLLRLVTRRPVVVEGAMLSWSLVEIPPTTSAAAPEVQVGNRHDWIGAMDDEPARVVSVALVALAELARRGVIPAPELPTLLADAALHGAARRGRRRS